MSAATEIAGYVEATTATQIVGWAWTPGTPGQRVLVQALLDDAVIAEAAADRARDDLARNGIGDGRHAFELQLPEMAATRRGELRVIAKTTEGVSAPLSLPPRAESVDERLAILQRGVDALVASQRVLHRNLQAALTAPRGGEAAPEIAALQEKLAKQIASVELFAMRLDEQFTAPSHAPSSGHARAALGAFVVAGLALAISIWGLWRQFAW